MTPDAIQSLYATHAYAVHRRCRQLLRDDDEARDAMHEVFLKVLEEPDRFQRRSSPATFLFGVATNLCLNRLRDRAVRGAEWQERVAFSLDGGRPSAADAAEARQLAAAVLAEADPETATMALYHFVDGLTQGEVASLVGVSRVTVNQRLQRFRAAARRRAEGK